MMLGAEEASCPWMFSADQTPPCAHAMLAAWLSRLFCGEGLGGDGIEFLSSSWEFWLLELKTDPCSPGIGSKWRTLEGYPFLVQIMPGKAGQPSVDKQSLPWGWETFALVFAFAL